MTSPTDLRVADDLRVETIDDEVVVLDAVSGIVFRLQGVAARIVATLHAGGTLADEDLAASDIFDALREARIIV
jgi:hypothetical protein